MFCIPTEEIFQFTPLREGRPHTIVEECVNRPFQFTPLREGRQLLNETRGEVKYFNSRPSARGDNFYKEAFDNLIISIHAPPRGATRTTKRYFPQNKIFQFTPLREGRQATSTACRTRRRNFNSRPSARGDARRICIQPFYADFNSRPSARGDEQDAMYFKHQLNFNSRPSARGDTMETHNGNHYVLFQFTPLREGRLTGC